ncbi:MAG TPA: RluA family pseudouridine synthase [bacterium]|nr:RluA family pseudouridine synthase [bacterium]
MESLKVTKDQNGLRLDQYLAKAKAFSRKKAKQLIDEGRVFLGDRKVIIGSWEVKAGETWSIRAPGDTAVPRRERYLKVHHEDKDLLVVEKPPGVACESTAQTLTSTLVDDINDYLRRAHPDIPHPYVGLMHRLDRETSGLMVYTLTREANALSDQFKRHTIVRHYLALVDGRVTKPEGRIESAIVKDLEAKGKKMKAVKARKGAEGFAVTEFRVLERYRDATLIEARLETGRTHQVRVHLASLGHPVIGDKLYGSKIKAPRHALHSAYLEFKHPLSGKKMIFRSKPPNDFKNLQEKFRADAVGLKASDRRR